MRERMRTLQQAAPNRAMESLRLMVANRYVIVPYAKWQTIDVQRMLKAT